MTGAQQGKTSKTLKSSDMRIEGGEGLKTAHPVAQTRS